MAEKKRQTKELDSPRLSRSQRMLDRQAAGPSAPQAIDPKDPGKRPEAIKAKPIGPETRGPEVGGTEAGGAEVGGPDGPEPTRFGDWERNGRCIDF